MQPQLLDLFSNRLSLLKHLTKPLIKKEGQTHLVLREGKPKVHSVTHAHNRSLSLPAGMEASDPVVCQA